MDHQKEIEKLLVPLEVLTVEELRALDKRTRTGIKQLSPATAFPPIPCDNGGLIKHVSSTDSFTEEKSLVSLYKDQSPTQLPQIRVMPDSQEETKPFLNFSNHINWIHAKENAWSEVEDRIESAENSEVLKKEVVSLRETMKRELESAREIILQARIALLAKKSTKSNKSQVGCGENHEREITGQETAESKREQKVAESRNGNRKKNSSGRKFTVRSEPGGIAAVFAKVKKATSKDKKRRQNSKHNLEKYENTPTEVVNSNKVYENGSNETFMESDANNDARRKRHKSNTTNLKQIDVLTNETTDSKSKAAAKCVVITFPGEKHQQPLDSEENSIVDYKSASPNKGESDLYCFKQVGEHFQQGGENMADVYEKERNELEKRFRVPKDEMRIINELYKLHCKDEAMRLRALVETKKKAERELRRVLTKEKKKSVGKKKRKEKEEKYHQGNEISIKGMEAKLREDERMKELEHQYLTKKRFELLKRRQLWDEEKNLEMAGRTSSSFSFSYFPPLPKCRRGQSMDDDDDDDDDEYECGDDAFC